MRYITFSTKRYVGKLLDLLASEALIYAKSGDEHFLSLPYGDFRDIISYEKLEDALENMVLERNDIIKKSEKALAFIKKTVFKEHRKKILYDIASIIECKNELNIDGYIEFKMQKFTLEIDRVLYSVVKRSGKVSKEEQ